MNGSSIRGVVRAASQRLLLIALGLALALVSMEGILRLGAAIVSATDHPGKTAWITGRQRILFLGDSNTYGLYVEPPEAYPQALEDLAGADIEAFNLGWPGNNSSNVRAVLSETLTVLHPDMVCIMIGVNDFWTPPAPDRRELESKPTITDTLWRHSRVFRLFFMLRRALSPETVAVSFEENETVARYGEATIMMGKRVTTVRPAGPPDWPTRLHDNLVAITGAIRDAGAVPILLTYPADRNAYKSANRIVREVAAATSTELIDLAAYVQSRCAGSSCEDLFFFDDHPTAEGHRIAAARILEEMADRGLVDAEAARQPTAN